MEKKVHFVSDGILLSGLLGFPEGAGPFPAVVLCNGMSLVKEVWLPANARALREQGFATLLFDYRTFGESLGEPRCRLTPQLQVRDTRNAISFLQTFPEIDPERIGVYGTSLGATVASSTAGQDSRVRAGVAVAGPGNLQRVWSAFPGFTGFRDKVLAARRKFVASNEVTHIAVQKLLSSDPATVEALEQEHPRHERWRLEVTFESILDLFEMNAEADLPHTQAAMCWIYPEKDQLIAGSEAASMYACAPEPKKLACLPNTEHAQIYTDPQVFYRLMQVSIDWFQRHLMQAEV